MTTAIRALLGLFLCGCGYATTAAKGPAGVASDVPTAPKSIAALRSRGQQGLDEALRIYDGLQAKLVALKRKENELHSVDPVGKSDEAERRAEVETRFEQLGKQVRQLELRIERAAAAIDQVGGQRSCSVSRLYWYTDLEEAKAAAAAVDRPILSLRMLGKLTDEYSCANSRFFRTALYSNQKLGDFLRTNFVLHWQSVRPVPRVTIDFGDGRKLERTLTGNSAHYVLASDGTPLDVLPGLYSPLAFQQWAWDVHQFYIQYQKAAAANRAAMLQAFHKQQNEELLKRWDFDIQRLGTERAELAGLRINHALTAARLVGRDVPTLPAVRPPTAIAASKLAVGKTQAEAPVLRFANLGCTWMERGMDDELWQAIAELNREDVQLDEASVVLMRREAPPAADAARRAVAKYAGEDPILRVVRAFEDSMALDTVRNEYLLHRRIHEHFAAGDAATTNVDTLNEWVYAELFLTPSSDPWLGLAPRDVYTALDGDGRTVPAAPLVGRSGG